MSARLVSVFAVLTITAWICLFGSSAHAQLWEAEDGSGFTHADIQDWVNNYGPFTDTGAVQQAAYQWCMTTSHYVNPAIDCQPHGSFEDEVVTVPGYAHQFIVNMYRNDGFHGRVWVLWFIGQTTPADCPAGQAIGPDGYNCVDTEYYVDEPPQECTPAGTNESNPCDPANGNKSQVEPDYIAPGSAGIDFVRYYNSTGPYRTAMRMPPGWRHSYSRTLDEAPDRRPAVLFTVANPSSSANYSTASAACTSGWGDIKNTAWQGDLAAATASYEGADTCKLTLSGNTVAYLPIRPRHQWPVFTASSNIKTLVRPNGSAIRFELDGTDWVNRLNPLHRLEQVAGFWIYTDPNDTQEKYDSDGKLVEIVTRSGETTTLSYTETGSAGDGNPNTLDKVTGPYGHFLRLKYSSGRLNRVETPEGQITLDYHANNTLRSVLLPWQKTRRYFYEDADLPYHLTGIEDRNGDRYITWTYDDSGRATRSEKAGGKERVDFVYNANGTTTLTMGNGATRTYDYSAERGSKRLEALTGDVCSTCPGGNISSITYDTNGFVYDRTDWEGNTTRTVRNAKGQILTLTEGLGSPEERSTTMQWHTTFNLPTQVVTPKNTTDYTYNTDGRPTQISVTDGVDTRTWTMTYDTLGKILSIDGPKAGAADLLTFSYHNCSWGAKCGNIRNITDAKGHQTRHTSYTTEGWLARVYTPNDLKIDLTYDFANKTLKTVKMTPTVGTARTISMTHDGERRLKSVTYPNGQVISYDYDAAGYLVEVSDNLNNRIEYGYDSMGNLASEDTYDPTNTLERAMDYVYDLNNRLERATAANSFNTDYVLDDVGNLKSTTDPDLALTQHSYDALNRVKQTTDALLGLTGYVYDDHDNLTSVTAPNSAVTTYEYNDFDDLTKEISPDRGTTTYTHDPAGNVLTKTDARGKLTTYTYDDLDRPTEIELDNLDTIDFEYDVGTHAKGYLNKVTDTSGNTQWTYNQFGEITSKTQTIGTVVLTTSYGYDAQGRMTSITLPSGKVVTYGFNTYQPVSVTVDSTTVLSAATYEPFGSVNGWTWGDTTTRTRSFDLRGLETSHSLAADTRTLGYSSAGELMTLDDTRHDLDFDYDALRRLFDFDALGLAPLTSQDFGYDANGNRLSFTEGASYAYTVTANTNRVATVAGPVAKTYTYDAAGNITNDGTTAYTYDDRGRMVTAGTATYTYDGLGQRVKKDNGTVTLFAYDEEGNLIGEYDSAGNPIREHVWFDGAPVAVIVGTDVHYVHTDHLGTPRAITASGTVIWRWESDPFGSTAAQEDPDGNLVGFTYNLRFPGQYYDSESGLHYNYFRTYDPSVGRYLENDPIGLQGGLNTYGYVYQNPLSYVDPTGELGIARHLYRLLQPVTKQTRQEAEVAGMIADSIAGAAATSADLTFCEEDYRYGREIGTALDVVQVYGGVQTVALSGAVSTGLYGFGAAASSAGAAVALPVALAGLGGLEIGGGLNSLYQRATGTSLGSQIYDLIN